MQATLAFDVYGTLIDPLGISVRLGELIGDSAQEFAHAWRDKQIEYLFRRGLGRKYEPFSVCTRQALDHTCLVLDQAIDENERDDLMRRYVGLPAYPGTVDALAGLREDGHRLFAFSNGEPDDLSELLSDAGLNSLLDGIVSVHATRSFKPDPSVYAYFLENTGAMLGYTWLVSGNAFDIIGAHESGWRTAWVRRSANMIFDPWGIEPTVTVTDLGSLRAAIAA